MELKDIILETIQEVTPNPNEPKNISNFSYKQDEISKTKLDFLKESDNEALKTTNLNAKMKLGISQKEFLKQLQEKTFILFEGLKNAPDNRKLDLVINYLEYQLSLLQNELEE